MKRLLLLFLMLNCLSCGSQRVIYIQPWGNVEQSDIDLVKSEVESFYRIKCTVKPPISLTDDLLADSKTRYEANKMLSKFDSNGNQLILTQSDIACENKDKNIKEWGIFGLGYTPGNTCVVSTFRLKRNASTELFTTG